jgi:hypothetical protein
MKRGTVFCGVMILSLIVISARAADITGKWTGQAQEKGEAREIIFDLKVEGAKLKGAVSGAITGPILDGKVSGDELSFTVVMERGSEKRVFKVKGKIASNEIKFTLIREGSDGKGLELTAKRAAK